MESSETDPDTPGQVAAISSTDSALDRLSSSGRGSGASGRLSGSSDFKTPGIAGSSPVSGNALGSSSEGHPAGPERTRKGKMKKRKRCGECTGGLFSNFIAVNCAKNVIFL